MNIELVLAKDTDKTFLLNLRKLTMIEHLKTAGLFLSDQDHLNSLEKHFENSYIITSSKQKIGLLKYIETEKKIEIIQFQVLPEYQNKGIGTYLLNHLFSIAIKSSKPLELKVLKENPARYLYKEFGFKIIDEDSHEFYMQKQVY